jgi:hypothetical protein
VSAGTARTLYLSALFLLLISNGISALISTLGLRGMAFYHVQAVVLLLCVTQLAVLTISGKVERRVDTNLFIAIVGSALYTLLSVVLLLRFPDVIPAYVVLLLHTLLFYPTTALLMLGCSRVDAANAGVQPQLPKWLPWASALVVLFGWLQFALRDPILVVTNGENVSKLVESNTLGTFRPPSLFESSFQYGLFSLLVCSLATAYGLMGEKRWGAWALAGLGISGVLLSQTRNVFLCAGCTAFSLWLLVRARQRAGNFGLLRIAPVGYVLAAISVMAYAVWQFLQSGLEKSGDLADASSTWARVSSWQRAWETLVRSGSFFDVVFGYGITQAGHASDYRSLYPSRGDGLFIDSTFVNVFLLQGLLGLFFFLLIWWLLWRRLLRKTLETWNPLTVGVTAFFSAFLAAGVFNILNGQWWGITLSLVLVVLTSKLKKVEISCAA